MTGFVHPWYFDGLRAIEKLAATGEPFTIDDVVAMVGEPPRPNMRGRLMPMALGTIKRTGRSPKSSSPTRRGGRNSEWIGAGFPLPVEPVEESRQGALL